MKRFFSFFLIFGLIIMSVGALATNRTKQAGDANESGKSYIAYGGTAADTIVVSDTLNYISFVAHFYSVNPELQFNWTKIGSGTATLKFDVLQSVDGVNYYTVKKGSLLTAYTKTYTISATGSNVLSFANDTAYFEGRYIKYQLSTTNTASVKGKLTFHQKINIR